MEVTMPRGHAAHKMLVLNAISELPTEQRGPVLALHKALDKVEFLRIAPFYFALFSLLIGPLFAQHYGANFVARVYSIRWIQSLLNIERIRGLASSEGIQVILIIIGFTLLYLLGLWFLRLCIKPTLETSTIEAEIILRQTPQQAIDILKQLDPNMVNNIKKSISL